MSSESEFIRAEVPEIAAIVRNECWLEGERRGEPVDPRDDVIRTRVAEIILSGVGAYLRRVHGESGSASSYIETSEETRQYRAME